MVVGKEGTGVHQVGAGEVVVVVEAGMLAGSVVGDRVHLVEEVVGALEEEGSVVGWEEEGLLVHLVVEVEVVGLEAVVVVGGAVKAWL